MADAEPKELRECFKDDEARWHDIKAARQSDIKALSEDSTWDDKDREARAENNRLCLSFDELGQYVNQLVNDIRETDRAIEVNPAGDSQSNAEAQVIAGIVRQIEYRSNAQLAYTRMFEDAAQGGYGFLRIVPRYVQRKVSKPGPRSFDQELIIEPVHNPDLVLPGFFTKPDFSDCDRFWVHERFTERDFKKRFGKKSEIESFRGLAAEVGALWVDDKGIWVRELWEIKTKPRTLLLFQPLQEGGEPLGFWEDEVPEEDRKAAIKRRTVDQPYVCQTITNGVEVLEKKEDWPGQYLPFVGCVGKMLWMEETLALHSLIRKSLDGQQLLNYTVTGEAEAIGMTPKIPWFFYKGTLDQDNEAALLQSNVKPVGAIGVDPQTDAWPFPTPPPFPQRTAYEPPVQAFEMAAESTRRRIQAAMGTGFLPTQAQRQNEKSGIALKQIANSAQKGAYHFVDHFEHALRRTGEILVDAIPHYYDTRRTIALRKKDGESVTVRINDPQAPPVKEFGDGPAIIRKDSEFDITISTGPSYESERDKASEFADQLVSSQPGIFQVLGPEIIKLKNLGPIGDSIAQFLEALQPPAIQALKKGQQFNAQAQQMQAQLQQAQQMIAKLQQALQSGAHLEQVKQQGQMALKQVDGQIKLALAELQGAQKRQELAVKVAADMETREDEQIHDLAVRGADAAQQERAAALARLNQAQQMAEAPDDPMA